MIRVTRRKFIWVATAGTASVALSACGNDPEDVNLHPTLIADVPGAPPTLPPGTPGAASGDEEAPAGGEEAAENVVGLEAQDPYAWSTNDLQAAPGQIIRTTNTGLAEHNFVVDEWGVEEGLPPGEPVDITVPDSVAIGDTYIFYCSITGHRQGGMEGTLTIIEAAAPAEASPVEENGAEAAPADSGAGGGEPTVLEAQDPYAWSVTEIAASPGQILQITNTGLTEHNFVVDEWGIEQDLPNGEMVEVPIPDTVASGESYVYYCSVAGHRQGGMEGTIAIA